MNQHTLVEHIFRHEYGLLVAALSHRFGPQSLDQIEDAVQYATMQALENWVRQGQPENPSGWLYKVAYRHLLSALRNDSRRREKIQEQVLYEEVVLEKAEPDIPLPGEMTDAMLRMLFAACDEAIPLESQLVFTLKALCGFSVKEIALRLFTSEENIYKRFTRARQHLAKQVRTSEDEMVDATIRARLPVVHKVLYLMFTEGYLSSQNEMAIRRDLCEEAIHLTGLLSASHLGSVPATQALLALMYLHFARLGTRQDEGGELLLFEQQKREQWDKGFIARGLYCLQASAQGDELSRYHLEASIAAEHCLAPSFEQTRWEKIVRSYEYLASMSPSPMVHLNKVVAMAEWRGPEEALAELQSLNMPVWLQRSYYWYAVEADLLQRCGQRADAQKAARLAVEFAPTEAIQKLLRQRLGKSLVITQ